jgi:hypothetical protein
MLSPLLLCVSNPIFYNLFPIKRSNHDSQTIKDLESGNLCGKELLSKFQVWAKSGISELCKIVFKSDINSGKTLKFQKIQGESIFYINLKEEGILRNGEFNFIYLKLDDYKLLIDVNRVEQVKNGDAELIENLEENQGKNGQILVN